MTEELPETECVNHGDEGGCQGPVLLRMALSGSGVPYPRCARHWDKRLDREEQIRERYPQHQPTDFDPMYAGESWDEDY